MSDQEKEDSEFRARPEGLRPNPPHSISGPPVEDPLFHFSNSLGRGRGLGLAMAGDGGNIVGFGSGEVEYREDLDPYDHSNPSSIEDARDGSDPSQGSDYRLRRSGMGSGGSRDEEAHPNSNIVDSQISSSMNQTTIPISETQDSTAEAPPQRTGARSQIWQSSPSDPWGRTEAPTPYGLATLDEHMLGPRSTQPDDEGPWSQSNNLGQGYTGPTTSSTEARGTGTAPASQGVINLAGGSNRARSLGGAPGGVKGIMMNPIPLKLLATLKSEE